MRMRELVQERPVPWGIPASLALHVAFLLALAMAPGLRLFPPLPENSIDVEIISAPPSVAPKPVDVPPPDSVPRAPPLRPDAGPVPSSSDTPGNPAPGALVRARRLFSERVLADPRSRQAREALPTLAPDDRADQLCGIEAMEQVHAWKSEFQPDRLISFALADTTFSGNTLLADGAAFRSKRQWYGLKFKCELTPDRRNVASFEFLVGDPVPRSEWEAHNLPPIH